MLGVAFAVVTLLVGDYVAPLSEREGVRLHNQFRSGSKFCRASAWLKEHRQTPEGERSYSVQVGSASAQGQLEGVRIFEFDADGRLCRASPPSARTVGDDAVWQLRGVEVTRWNARNLDGSPLVSEQLMPALSWPSTLDCRRGRGRGAADQDDVDGRAVALHAPPGQQRTGRPAP